MLNGGTQRCVLHRHQNHEIKILNISFDHWESTHNLSPLVIRVCSTIMTGLWYVMNLYLVFSNSAVPILLPLQAV